MTDYTFDSLASLVAEKKEVWVHLYNELKICLIGVTDPVTKVFSAKMLPCAANSRVYQIRYDQIQSLSNKPGG